MTHKPYSSEWTRQRYLAEAISKYFEEDEGVDPFLEDLNEILSGWLDTHERRATDLKTLLGNLN